MKISCAPDELLRSVQTASRGLSSRAIVQVLSGMLLTAETPDAPCELAATDMELSVRAPLSADVAEPGRIVVPGRLLVDIARRLPPERVTISQGSEGGLLQLECGSSRYELHAFSAEDFPRLPDVDAERLFRVDRATFLATVERVMRAASKDESRPVLTGILIEFRGDRVTMAATDSYRMAVKSAPLAGGPPEDLDAIVPTRALGELVRIAAGAEGDGLDIEVGQNQVVFGVGGAWLSARRIDGQFPNYRQLLPDAFEHDVVVGREDLLGVLGRMEVLAHRASPLRLRFTAGEMTVSAQTVEVGEGHESLPCDFRGEPLEIGFNATFLRDGIESVEDDQVHLKLISPLRPGVVTGAGEDFWYLAMPMRLSTA